MRHLIATLTASFFILTTPAALAGGDATKGKEVALAKGCAGCHGVDGNSAMAQWPNIAGLGAKYMAAQLVAFRENDVEKSGRVDPQMAGFAKNLSDQDIADISAYFAGQKVRGGEADPKLVKLGNHIYRGGDKDRGLPSCMGCHGPTGAGNPAAGYPGLAGQWAPYTQKQLAAFKSETRRNDANRMMRDIASKLRPEEIEAVASYIQGLKD